jgi:hypothetical protein
MPVELMGDSFIGGEEREEDLSGVYGDTFVGKGGRKRRGRKKGKQPTGGSAGSGKKPHGSGGKGGKKKQKKSSQQLSKGSTAAPSMTEDETMPRAESEAEDETLSDEDDTE